MSLPWIMAMPALADGALKWKFEGRGSAGRRCW